MISNHVRSAELSYALYQWWGIMLFCWTRPITVII